MSDAGPSTPFPGHRFWAPWRMAYIAQATGGSSAGGCIFCDRANSDGDEGDLCLARDAHALVLLNKFPYVRGHVMVSPHRHVGSWTELGDDERTGLLLTTRRAAGAIHRAYAPDRVYVGSNLGRPAGAGIPGHLHVHLVPEVAADAPRAIPDRAADAPEPLAETARRLRAAW